AHAGDRRPRVRAAPARPKPGDARDPRHRPRRRVATRTGARGRSRRAPGEGIAPRPAQGRDPCGRTRAAASALELFVDRVDRAALDVALDAAEVLADQGENEALDA